MTSQDRTNNSGILAIVTLATIYGLTAVMARYLSRGLGLFEQWYLRYAIGTVLCVVCFYTQVDYHKFIRLAKRDWLVLLFRSFVGSVIGIALYTLASQKAKIGPVAFMQVVPTTALFGVVLLKEKMSIKQLSLVLLSFFGAALVAVRGLHDLTSFNVGEIYSLVSGALFSLVLIARKWQTNRLNNYEMTVAITTMSFVMDYIISVCLYKRAFIASSHWTNHFTLVLLGASVLGVAINFLSSYGFEHVAAILASSLLDLELVMGALFGYLFYHEALTKRELIGGLIILTAAVSMSQLSRRSPTRPTISIPD